MLEIARERLPDADLRVGDLQFPPYESDTFDAVAGFNSFQFAADMPAALREAGRVAKPGARVAIQVWGRAEACDLMAMVGAIGPILPTPPPSGPGGRPLSDPGVLEELAAEAGLTPRTTGDVVWALEFPSDEAMMEGMMSAGLVVLAARIAGEETVRALIVEALEPFRSPTGAYRLGNEWHYLIAEA